MAWQAVTVVRTLMRNDQRSIALDMPMAIPHAALLVGFALCALVVVARRPLRRASQADGARRRHIGDRAQRCTPP